MEVMRDAGDQSLEKRIAIGSSHEPQERTAQMPARPAAAMGTVLHARVQS